MKEAMVLLTHTATDSTSPPTFRCAPSSRKRDMERANATIAVG